jgi:hypothetical protein
MVSFSAFRSPLTLHAFLMITSIATAPVSYAGQKPSSVAGATAISAVAAPAAAFLSSAGSLAGVTSMASLSVKASVASAITNASLGAGSGGGGDVCQDRIESIRNDISKWIQKGGSAGLDFSKTKTSLADYNAKMQGMIALTRVNDQTAISCTDDIALVQVDGTQKTCVAYPDPKQPRVLCYRGQSQNGQFVTGFMGLSQDDQYFQVHHEFTVLAGFEDQAKQSSDYPLSDQISGYLVDQTVRKLAVKGQAPQAGAKDQATIQLANILKGKKLSCEPADHHKPYSPAYRGDDGYFDVSVVSNKITISNNGSDGYGFSNGSVGDYAFTGATTFVLTVGDDGSQTLMFDFNTIGSDSSLPADCANGNLVSEPDQNEFSSSTLTCCLK